MPRKLILMLLGACLAVGLGSLTGCQSLGANPFSRSAGLPVQSE